MIGLGLLGEKFYFPERLRYRPVFFSCSSGYFSHLSHYARGYGISAEFLMEKYKLGKGIEALGGHYRLSINNITSGEIF
jgi:hypothetical protein